MFSIYRESKVYEQECKDYFYFMLAHILWSFVVYSTPTNVFTQV